MVFAVRRCASMLAVAFILGTISVPDVRADDPPKKEETKAKGPERAPADYVLLDSERAGAYFVSKPLKDQYDALREKLSLLRQEIREARIEAPEAQRRVRQLQTDMDELRRKMDESKLYIPGATVHSASESRTISIEADGLLLIECGDVEVRGWDRPEVRVVLEKTVFSEDGKDVAADFAGITVVHKKMPAREKFGFYVNIADKPQWKAEWDRFPFKDFLDRDILHVTIQGLTHEQGNRQIRLEMRNEQGLGSQGSDWRRHARLVLFVPRCRGVGIMGGLEGLKVHRLHAPLTILGSGDRDYTTTYEVSDLDGPLKAENISIHRLDRVRGDASVVMTAYLEDGSNTHDDRGITSQQADPRPSEYRDISGDLTVHACRADLTIERIAGRVDIRNDFGRTTWRSNSPLAKRDHRVVSESGTIELAWTLQVLGDLSLSLLTECGIVRLAPGLKIERLDPTSVSGGQGDDVRRSWRGFCRSAGKERVPGFSFEAMIRASAALQDKEREPGVDILDRAGTIVLSPFRDEPAER